MSDETRRYPSSARARIASVFSALVLVIALSQPAAAGASTSTAGARSIRAGVVPGAHGPVPSDPDIDYHPVVQSTDSTSCTEEFGVGVGYCLSDPGDTTMVPRMSGGLWQLHWWPCGQGPIRMTSCQPGWFTLQISIGDNRVNFFMTGRGAGNLYFLNADAPAWHSRSAITAPPAPFSAGRGDPGGPLSINARDYWCLSGDCYKLEIKGYLLYKLLARTFTLSGFIEYANGGAPPASHPLTAKLDVFDTPTNPACNATYPVDTGGCRGTFTPDSTPPFRGAGGSIHWRKANDRYYLQQVIAPSGSKLDGNLYPSSNAYVVIPNQSAVPEWGTEIRTGPDFTAPGMQDGPLLSTVAACCGVSAPPLGIRIIRQRVDSGSRTAAFYFDNPAAPSEARFACKLDKGPYRPCRSPRTYRALTRGGHTFRVRITTPRRRSDRGAAVRRFKV